MDDGSIQKRLREVIVKALNLDVDPADIKSENMIEELGISSVDALEILIWVENEFDIMIDDNDLSQELVSSLTNLEGYIRERVSAAA